MTPERKQVQAESTQTPLVTNGQIDFTAIANRLEQIKELVVNTPFTRAELWRQLMDPRRNLEDECGYPRTDTTVDVKLYQQLFERDGVSAQVVEVLARHSWQVQPWVYEVENPERITPFERTFDNLSKNLQGTNSYYQSDRGSPLWSELRQIDELSGIGHYGVLLCGFDDGNPLEQPVPFIDKANPPTEDQLRKLLFLRAFPEHLAEIAEFDRDPRSPRFGWPMYYNLTLYDPREVPTNVFLPSNTFKVHWTRVIHVADTHHTASTSKVLAVPRMRPVLNYLLGLRKLLSGSAEMYWRGAFFGLSFESAAGMGGEPIMDLSVTKDNIEQYMNGLQRYLLNPGLSVKSIAPQVVDPTPQIDAQITAICIKTKIPKRVLLGSERGELASQQDDEAWNDQVRERENVYVSPCIISPFVDRMINVGAVIPPKKSFYIGWPDLSSQTDQDRASVSVTKTQALAQYIQGKVEYAYPLLNYFVDVIGLEYRQAKQLVEQLTKQPGGYYTIPPEQPKTSSSSKTLPEVTGDGRTGLDRSRPPGTLQPDNAATASTPKSTLRETKVAAAETVRQQGGQAKERP